MQVPSAETLKLLTLLAETPHRLAVLTAGLDPAQLQTTFGEDVWSVNEILAHLRVCAEVWGKSIVAMLTQDRPTLRYVSPRTVAKKRDYATQEYPLSLQAFTQQRSELLQLLKPLDNDAWAREALFTGTTKGRDQTVHSYVQRIVAHEGEHLAQISTLLQGKSAL